MADQPTHSELSESLARSEARAAVSHREAFEASAWLAAIVENSEDAILSKTLDGIIMTWNAGAKKLFGYEPEEMIGRPITILIPEDRLHEEETIIARLRNGQRVEQLETVRRHKDGRLVDIALTVSPVKDEAGNVLGASKIARDITAAKQAIARQDLVIREMNHRIKNLFALTTGLVALSARAASNPTDLAGDLTARLQSLSRAHALTFPDLNQDVVSHSSTTLPALIKEVLAPHDDTVGSRIVVEGDPVPVGSHALPTLGLLFHELATNAAKYGALATAEGRLSLLITKVGDAVEIAWRETGGPSRQEVAPVSTGFGSRLEQASVASLHGTLNRVWPERGLDISITFPAHEIAH